MRRAFYSSSIDAFLSSSADEVLGVMTRHNQFDLTQNQRDAWIAQIPLLHDQLVGISGHLYLEFSIPRMGKRIDLLLLIDSTLFVVEFKIGEANFLSKDRDQVLDYALDLKNFHEGSHQAVIQPILVSSSAAPRGSQIQEGFDDLIQPVIESNGSNLRELIRNALRITNNASLQVSTWERSGYKPTPTIVEATVALYKGHRVEDIANNMAEENLSVTVDAINSIIEKSKESDQKSIIFVTGVPGAGKTLVGLDVASQQSDIENESYCVFLSGNRPLVSVLQEALVRDRLDTKRDNGEKVKKGEVQSQVKSMIQNVHHYRDEYLLDKNAPADRIALFDEAQRVWDKKQTVSFMKQKKNQPEFDASESEFLISCMDRHEGWATIICLVGGGQEINKGEAGINGWLEAVSSKFKDWRIYISPELMGTEYLGASGLVDELVSNGMATDEPKLHLKTSARAFRSNLVSKFVSQVLDLEIERAKTALKKVNDNYPIVLTRDLVKAKSWLKTQARGTERYGLVVSSQAERLRPYGIHVKAKVNEVNWFLDSKESVRSSYYLEDVATEFLVQGLELDWSCVIWDADFRMSDGAWDNWSFRGTKWQRIRKESRQRYQLNAYRVLLTRARQGMVVCVPEGDTDDPTRPPEYYDETYEYLMNLGVRVI